MEKINILLVDDHMLVRNGLKALLESEPYFSVIGEGANGEEAIELVQSLQPDILIIDVRMPILNGIEAVQELTKMQVNTKSIVLSMHDSQEYIIKAINAGAWGYLLKDTNKPEFIKAINTVHKGDKYFSGDTTNAILSGLLNHNKTYSSTSNHGLTKKELEILDFILNGFTNQEISEKLGKSKRTVETHRFNLMKKLEVKNLVELSKKVQELGIQ